MQVDDFTSPTGKAWRPFFVLARDLVFCNPGRSCASRTELGAACRGTG